MKPLCITAIAANDAVSTIKTPAATAGNTDDTVRTFDAMGRVAAETKPGAAAGTTYTYDLAGRLLEQGGALTYTSAYGYDLQGRMTALATFKDTTSATTKAATIEVTAWAYNPLGQVSAKTYPIADSDGDGTPDEAVFQEAPAEAGLAREAIARPSRPWFAHCRQRNPQGRDDHATGEVPFRAQALMRRDHLPVRSPLVSRYLLPLPAAPRKN